MYNIKKLKLKKNKEITIKLLDVHSAISFDKIIISNIETSKKILDLDMKLNIKFYDIKGNIKQEDELSLAYAISSDFPILKFPKIYIPESNKRDENVEITLNNYKDILYDKIVLKFTYDEELDNENKDIILNLFYLPLSDIKIIK